MDKWTHEEYTEWCLDNGLFAPTLCIKCGGSYHYVCAECEPEFFGRERLNPEGKHEYGVEATAAWQDWMFPCDSLNSENK